MKLDEYVAKKHVFKGACTGMYMMRERALVKDSKGSEYTSAYGGHVLMLPGGA